MAGEALNVRGPCSSCGAQLATDQRYCVECGQRVGPPLALPYIPAGPAGPAPAGAGWLSALPFPLQTATMLAALALGFGVVVGTAISPQLAGIVAAPGPGATIEQPPIKAPSEVGGGGGGASGGGAGGAAVAVASTPTTESGGGGGGGGGGHSHKKGKKKKKKQQQPATPVTFSGTVVRANPVAGSYTISNGSLVSIHADSLPDVGQKLEVPVRQLINGTYAEQGARNAVGTADSAGFTGLVTYCADLEEPSAPCDGSSPTDHYVYSVSGVGASVLINAPYPAQAPPPGVGSQVDVTVQIGDPFAPIEPADPASWAKDETCTPPYDEQHGLPASSVKAPELTQTGVSVTAQATSATAEAVVQTVCPGESPKLVLSADDVREAGRDLAALPVPAGIDLAKLSPGQAVQAAIAIGADGKLSLQGITSDQGTAGADDPAQGQGSLVGK